MVVFAFLGVALFLGVAWWNHWTARRLQRQLDAVEGQGVRGSSQTVVTT
jgi:hypothetical protein